MIGAHKTVSCIHRRAFDNRQNISLHTLAADVRTMTGFATRDLIYLIEENDPVALHTLQSDARDLIHIDQLLFLFLDQIFRCFGYAHLALTRALAEKPR